MEKNLRQFAGLFAVCAVLGAAGLAFAGFNMLSDYRASGVAWVYFVAAFAVAIQGLALGRQ